MNRRQDLTVKPVIEAGQGFKRFHRQRLRRYNRAGNPLYFSLLHGFAVNLCATYRRSVWR